MSTSNTTPIGLAELIDQVKRELLSPSRNDNDIPLLGVEQVEIQATITVKREGNGGINIHVLNIGAGVSKEDAQTVRVLLKPLRSPEQLIAELREQSPEDYDRIVKQASKTMRSAESRKGRRSIP